MFQRLLICTDLMDGLYRLANFIPSLVSGGAQHITFLHVLPFEGREIPRVDERKAEQARQRLAVAEEQVPEGVEVKVEIQSGKPIDRILATAQQMAADVILLGGESRTLLTEKLFGSTTANLCQGSKVPVLLMRPQLLSTYTNEELDLRCRHIFRYFLIPYDGGKASEYAVSQVKKYAEQHNHESMYQSLLLTVIEENDRLDKMMHENRVKEAETKLAVAKKSLEGPNLTVTAEISFGEPVVQTLIYAIDYDITAIAIASSTMGKFVEWSKNSFAGEILRRSWHPVLFFPPVL
jgi:nucleotide-binding universal stress UspA family protein